MAGLDLETSQHVVGGGLSRGVSEGIIGKYREKGHGHIGAHRPQPSCLLQTLSAFRARGDWTSLLVMCMSTEDPWGTLWGTELGLGQGVGGLSLGQLQGRPGFDISPGHLEMASGVVSLSAKSSLGLGAHLLN